MNPVITALIGFGGVILGAMATLLSPALADRRQARSETRRWRRDQLATAYEQALRFLLRAANRRSRFQGGRGSAVLNEEHQREWFDDLVEAQVWLRTVTRYCDATQVDRIRRTAAHLDTHVSRLVSGERFDRKDYSIWHVLQSCITTVTECARLDGGSSFPASNERDSNAGELLASHNMQNIVMGDISGFVSEVLPGNIRMSADEPSGEAQERS